MWGWRCLWYTTWFSALCQRCFSCCSFSLAGSATFLAPVSWPTPAVEPGCWVGGVFGASLGSLPCAVLFLRGLHFAQLTLPQVPLWGFSAYCVTGCPSFCCPGDVGWAATLPFSFSVLLLLRLADRGSLGSAPCIRVLQLGLCLLFGRQCNLPACFPFP